MTPSELNDVIEAQFERCRRVLKTKADEYAPVDRLANFKKAAALRNISPRQALAGMLAKHTVSVYDMADDGGFFPMEMWDEKITDHINYLLLLRAIIQEDQVSVDYPVS
jgi:hypothetical protein